mgnify:FL=1
MRTLFLTVLFMCSIGQAEIFSGSAELIIPYVQSDKPYIMVNGAAADALYEKMTKVTAVRVGEMGEHRMKLGADYWCYADYTSVRCGIYISALETGSID